MAFSIKGQLSSFKGASGNGHLYFDLVDSESSVRVVMFRNYAYYLDPTIANGDSVIVYGKLNVYTKGGSYSIIATKMEKEGKGDKLVALEELKKKLDKEGLFSPLHKKKIPEYPLTIAVITAKNSAALKDIEVNINNRYPLTEIKVYGAMMQGADSAPSMILALKEAIKDEPTTIIISRGGGSNEDLSPFNDEKLAREAFACPYPIISAVGHEVDTTILDLVADVRASTPTHAAIISTPHTIEDLMIEIEDYKEGAKKFLLDRIDTLSKTLDRISSHPFLKNPSIMYSDKITELAHIKESLTQRINSLIERFSSSLDGNKKRLKALSPDLVLKRGYSLITDEGGKLIKTIDDIEENMVITASLSDGKIQSKVISKEKK